VDLVSVDGPFLPVRDLGSSLSDSPVLDLEVAAAASRSRHAGRAGNREGACSDASDWNGA
jgi:hypothetical protein